METKNILSLENINYLSKDSAKEAIKFITDIAGIKSIECDRPTDYTTFVNLEKCILTKILSLFPKSLCRYVSE